jgi:hypothetical protein
MRNARVLLAGLVFACGACTSVGTYVAPTCSGIFTDVPCVPVAQIPLTMDATTVRGCSFKGFVESHDANASWSEAENELRDQAVNRGGNVVLLLSQTGSGDMHEHSGGEAFDCPAAPYFTQPPASFVPASQAHSQIQRGPYCPPPID